MCCCLLITIFFFFLQVNLYSDGPQPGHLVQSVYNQEASKFMTLDFPQAQRAETSSISLPSDEQRTPQSIFVLLSIYHYISTRLTMIFVFWSDPPVTKEPSVTLYTQASDFLQRVKSVCWQSFVTRMFTEIQFLTFFLQLQTFEDLLKCQQLSPDEQRKVRSQVKRKSRN